MSQNKGELIYSGGGARGRGGAALPLVNFNKYQVLLQFERNSNIKKHSSDSESSSIDLSLRNINREIRA